LYRRVCNATGGVLRCFEGGNDALRVWIGGWRLKKIKGCWVDLPIQSHDLLEVCLVLGGKLTVS